MCAVSVAAGCFSGGMVDCINEVIGVMHLADMARAAEIGQPLWADVTTDLNANLLILNDGQVVDRHVNGEVDVLLVGFDGHGLVEMNGEIHRVGAGDAMLIPKGAERAVRSAAGRFVYLTCHRRREGIWPAGVRRPDQRPGP
jgi:quercetin dioxygenase-like cupin family protein